MISYGQLGYSYYCDLVRVICFLLWDWRFASEDWDYEDGLYSMGFFEVADNSWVFLSSN